MAREKDSGIRKGRHFMILKWRLFRVPGMAQVLRVKVPSRVFTAKCSEPQAEDSNV